jgi:hypothetical protein
VEDFRSLFWLLFSSEYVEWKKWTDVFSGFLRWVFVLGKTDDAYKRWFLARLCKFKAEGSIRTVNQFTLLSQQNTELCAVSATRAL